MHVIEPTTFAWKDSEFKRAGMDYIRHVQLIKHTSWNALLRFKGAARLVLIETDGTTPLWDFHFKPGDILILGRESAGVPSEIYKDVDATVRIPMKDGLRSMNVVNAAAIALGEALRQTRSQ